MPHATATFNGKIIAETDAYEFVEGNVYFPPSSVDKSVFTPSELHTFCPWKGTASYSNVVVDGKEAKDAAWYYPEAITERAMGLKDHVAFYKSKVDVKYE
ncbi:MAG: hypothetical protein LQ338_000881 [Usnochroma carphineum]|nr:MAG: hypothetical protein LQ338_000881 [Usnochroma carphineum]